MTEERQSYKGVEFYPDYYASIKRQGAAIITRLNDEEMSRASSIKGVVKIEPRFDGSIVYVAVDWEYQLHRVVFEVINTIDEMRFS